MAKKHHGPPHEEHPDETWLVPYADLLTLLLALFVVLFASAKADTEKFAQVAHAMNQALGGPITIGSGAQSILVGGAGVVGQGGSPPVAGLSPAELENAQLNSVKQLIEEFVQEKKVEMELETTLSDTGLVIRIRDNALFASGSAQLYPEALKLANLVAGVLGDIPQNVLVSGHTDNVPINTAQYPSNWELSSARALALMRQLLSANPKISPARMSAIGFGEYRPIVSNATEEGRSQNRRVEILIQRSYIRGERAEGTLINPNTGAEEPNIKKQ